MDKAKGRLSILRLLLGIAETGAAYNQFSLAALENQDITLCTYFKFDILPPKKITLFEGNGSLMGFFRVLNAALQEKEYDIIHAHSPHVGFLFLVASLMRRRLLQSTVYTVHNSYQNFKPRNKLLLIPVFASFQRVVCCGKASFDSFPVFYKWLGGDRICAVQNGMDIDRIDRVIGNNHKHIHNSNFAIYTVGRLVKIKNHTSVLEAFQQSVDQTSRLVFIGGGHLHDELLAKAKAFGIENQVELTGLIPRNSVYEHLAQADLFISASRGEGLPIAVLEAMTCRCPVILSDLPPHREIADGASFIPLVHPDDVNRFAREILRFQQMPSRERVEIGEKCRKLVEERFSLSTMLRGYEDVYDQVLSKN